MKMQGREEIDLSTDLQDTTIVERSITCLDEREPWSSSFIDGTTVPRKDGFALHVWIEKAITSHALNQHWEHRCRGPYGEAHGRLHGQQHTEDGQVTETTTHALLVVPAPAGGAKPPYLSLQILTDASANPRLITAIRDAVFTDKPLLCP
jgi:hypothetical protein